MNKSSHQVTLEDAKAALASIEAANKTTVETMKPPLWLILICSISLGIKTTAMGLMINNTLWNAIQWGSFIVFFLSAIAWIFALRIKGIRVKISDVNITKKGIVCALLICALLVLSRTIYLQTESILFPYLAGILNTLVLVYGLLFNVRLNVNANEKIKNNE